jgi:hypothetical protein
LRTTLEEVEVLLEGVEVIGPETAIAARPRIELGETFGPKSVEVLLGIRANRG